MLLFIIRYQISYIVTSTYQIYQVWHAEDNMTSGVMQPMFMLLTEIKSNNITLNTADLNEANLHYFKVCVLAYGYPGLFSNRVTMELPQTGSQ